MTELEQKELKVEKINFLVEQLIALDYSEYKNFTIEEDKSVPYLNGVIDLLKKQVANAKLNKAKLVKFDKLEAGRANLSKEELEQLIEDQNRNNEVADSILATLDPRASLKGKLYAPNSIIFRYRGKAINDEFNKKYPFGVLM